MIQKCNVFEDYIKNLLKEVIITLKAGKINEALFSLSCIEEVFKKTDLKVTSIRDIVLKHTSNKNPSKPLLKEFEGHRGEKISMILIDNGVIVYKKEGSELKEPLKFKGLHAKLVFSATNYDQAISYMKLLNKKNPYEVEA